MTIALITDTHLGARNNCTIFNSYFLKFFDEVFFPTLKEYDISTVIHLGDLGEYKRSVNTLILDSWNKHVFKPLSDYNVWMLGGNHDMFFKHKNTVSLQTSLELSNRYGFNTITESPEKLRFGNQWIDLVPWITSTNYTEIVEFIEQSTAEYLLCHLECAGALMIPGITCSESQLDSSLTSKYKQVFSGHFHLRSQQRNIIYIGNPYEITWVDVNQPKGFVLWNPEINSINYINNPNSIFYQLTVKNDEEVKDLDLSYCANKHVKLYTSSLLKTKTLDYLVSEIERIGVYSLSVQDKSLDLDNENMTISSECPDTLHYIKNFVNKLYENQRIHLDKKTLIGKLEQIYTQAQILVV